MYLTIKINIFLYNLKCSKQSKDKPLTGENILAIYLTKGQFS